jgi:hypothetical protein
MWQLKNRFTDLLIAPVDWFKTHYAFVQEFNLGRLPAGLKGFENLRLSVLFATGVSTFNPLISDIISSTSSNSI